MAANLYTIIDEPKPSRWSKFIVNPIVVLLLAMLLPLMWTPPMAGRYWLPLLWLVINGFILGSATWKKEVLYSLAGGLAMAACFYGSLLYFGGQGPQVLTRAVPYVVLALNGLLFFTLYLVVFTQSTSYELYQYIHRER